MKFNPQTFTTRYVGDVLYLTSNEDELVKSRKESICSACSAPTRWFHIHFSIFLCSTECLETATEYYDAWSAEDERIREEEEERIRYEEQQGYDLNVYRDEAFF